MTLLEEARSLIKAYLAAKPHLSIASLAKACGMPPTTARAIVQGEVQKTSVEKITALLLTFMSIESVVELVAKYDEHRVHLGSLKIFAERKVRFVASNEFDWQDPDHEIVALAAAAAGTSVRRICELFGKERGESRLAALLEAGLLREINGRIKQPEEDVLFSIADAQKRAALHMNRWRPADIDAGGFLYHIYQSITEEGYEEAKKAVKQCVDRLGEIKDEYKAEVDDDRSRVLLLSLAANLLKGSEK